MGYLIYCATQAPLGNVVTGLPRSTLGTQLRGSFCASAHPVVSVSAGLLLREEDTISASPGLWGNRGCASGVRALGTRLCEVWGSARSGRFVCGGGQQEVLGTSRRVLPSPSLCACAGLVPTYFRGAGGAESPVQRRCSVRALDGSRKAIRLYDVFDEHEATNSSLCISLRIE